jgi:outer membrane protein OmpA-like peptidoglycan-associated protein
MSNFLARSKSKSREEDPWLSISDLMAGLMVIFLFIAIVYIRPLVETQTKIETVTSAWEDAREKIYLALNKEFQEDLVEWQAQLEKQTLTIRFRAPDVLFETNSSEINERFKQILDSFFPRYLSVLEVYKTEIEEIRIEGHTSSEWSDDTTELQSYFNNMKLSQARTRAVLEYSFSKESVYSNNVWAHPLVTANGLSFSQKLLRPDGLEDKENSRRVEFRVRTNTDKKIEQIIQSLK